MLDKFFQYVGIRGVLAVALVGTVIGLAVAGRDVSPLLGELAAGATGFYFGSKGGELVTAARSFLSPPESVEQDVERRR